MQKKSRRLSESAATPLLSARISFAIKHILAHVFFYALPRIFSGLLWRWPRVLLSYLHLCAEPQDERAVTVIAHPGDPQHLRQRFALPTAATDPPMRYAAPLYNGHIETVLGGLRSGPTADFDRELVVADGGQRVNLDFLYPIPDAGGEKSSEDAAAAASASGGKAPHARGLLFVVPGLLNSSTTNYSRHFAAAAVREGFAVCVLNYRGMGTTPLEVPQLMSATFTSDVRYCLHHYLQAEQVQARLGTSSTVPLIAVGFSLGGVILIKYLGEQGQAAAEKAKVANLPVESVMADTPVSALFTVTAPYDLIAADQMCGTMLYRHLYAPPFAMGLRKYAKHNSEMLAKLPNIDAAALFEGPHPGVNRIYSIREFDLQINALHNGFATPRDYYAAAEPFKWLPFVRTPVFCLGDRNDVVAGLFVADARWQALVQANPNIVYVCFPVGGHLGFVGNLGAEWRGEDNEAERLVLRAAVAFCASGETKKTR